MLYGRLPDKNSYRCELLTDLSYPVVLLQGSQSSSDRFIERLRGDLFGVLDGLECPLPQLCTFGEPHPRSYYIRLCLLPIAHDGVTTVSRCD